MVSVLLVYKHLFISKFICADRRGGMSKKRPAVLAPPRSATYGEPYDDASTIGRAYDDRMASQHMGNHALSRCVIMTL